MFARALCLVLALTSADAALARPNSLTMSCAQAANLVRAQGAVVMSTGRHTFDRYVRHGGFCLWPEVAVPAYAPTADARRCPIGYVCREPVFERFPFFDDFD
jgi:hypothetical protein